MTFSFACGQCGHGVDAEWSAIGRPLSCPHCLAALVVPAPFEPAGRNQSRLTTVGATSVHFRCPQCDRHYATKPSLAGRKIRCGGCGAGVRVPGVDGLPAAPRASAMAPAPSAQAGYSPPPRDSSPPGSVVPSSDDELEFLEEDSDPYGFREPLPPPFRLTAAAPDPQVPEPPIPRSVRRVYAAPRARGYGGGARGLPPVLVAGMAVLGLIAGGVRYSRELSDAFTRMIGFSSRTELERYVEDGLALTNELTEVMLSVHDPASAHAAIPLALAVLDKLEAHYTYALGKKALKVDLNAVNEKYKVRQKQSYDAAFRAGARLANVPGGRVFLSAVANRFEQVAQLERRLMAEAGVQPGQ